MSDTQTEVKVEKKDKKLPIIAVKGTGTDRKVVLWERHPDHPEKKYETDAAGEAFVSNDGIVREVAETPDVKRLLAEGLLVKASLSENEKNPKEPVAAFSRTLGSTLSEPFTPVRRGRPPTAKDDN